MEKFKTLNNQLCKMIVRNAVNGSARAVYIAMYNNYDCFTHELFCRIYMICAEFCPLTSNLFDSLPYNVQNFYNQMFIQNDSVHFHTV